MDHMYPISTKYVQRELELLPFPNAVMNIDQSELISINQFWLVNNHSSIGKGQRFMLPLMYFCTFTCFFGLLTQQIRGTKIRSLVTSLGRKWYLCYMNIPFWVWTCYWNKHSSFYIKQRIIRSNVSWYLIC